MERTKEGRICDSAVMFGGNGGGETQVLQHHPLPEQQNYNRDLREKEGGKVE